jgi:hypothetical protein
VLLLPFAHPRMASEYHGATTTRQLEPPGFLAMNYGFQTPLIMLVGQSVHSAMLGGLPAPSDNRPVGARAS